MRRSAISIPSNMSRRAGRNSFKEFRQFLSFALGSLAEIETQLIISKEINYLADDELIPLIGDLDIIRKMVKALANCLN